MPSFLSLSHKHLDKKVETMPHPQRRNTNGRQYAHPTTPMWLAGNSQANLVDT